MAGRLSFLLALACAFFLLCHVASAFTFCSFAGPETSADLLELKNFSVEGQESIKLGEKLTVKFQLKNVGQSDINFTKKGVFAAVLSPSNERNDFGFISTEQVLKPLASVSFEKDLTIDERGTWEIWPSYEILKSGTFMGKPVVLTKQGPEHWHSCFLSICPNYCEDSMRYFDGYIGQENQCVYSQENCPSGCDAQGIECAFPSTKDTTKPTVSVSYSPTDANTLSQIAFTARARDDAGISAISIFVGGNKQKECSGKALSQGTDEDGAYWECNYKGSPYPAGALSYSATAIDSSGNSGTSGEKEITVRAVFTAPPPVFVGCFNSVRGMVTDFPYPTDMLKVRLCEAQIVPLPYGGGSTLTCKAGGIERETALGSHDSFEFSGLCEGRYSISVVIQPSELFCRPDGLFWNPELTQGGARLIEVPAESRADFVFVPREAYPPELRVELSPSAPSTADEIRITVNASDPSGISRIKIEGNLEKTIRAIHHCRTETYEGHEIELCDEDFISDDEPINVECSSASCSYTIPRSSTEYYRYELAFRVSAFDRICNLAVADQNMVIMKPAPTMQANIRNSAAYRDRELFLVSDQDWRTAFSLVPVAFGTKCTEKPEYFPPVIGSDCYYPEETKVPLIIFHQEGPDYNRNFDLDSAIIFANQYKPQGITLFVGNETINAELDDFLYYWFIRPHEVLPRTSWNLRDNLAWFLDNDAALIRLFDASDISQVYNHYFSTVRSVLVCEDSYAAGILCASFASQANLPLYFENHFDVSDIEGKVVHVAGNVSPSTMSLIRAHALELGRHFSGYRGEEFESPYSLDDLASGQPKTVLTSPHDLDKPTNFSHDYSTSTWGEVTSFWKMSMAAPLYTAARGGLIKLLEADIQLRSDSECSDSSGHQAIRNAIDTVKEETRYIYDFVIIAAPPYIPDSYYTSCSSGWAHNRQQVDRQYEAVGRVYGITVTDASAYIMRSVFYDELVPEPEKTRGLVISHSIGPDEHDASAVIDYLKRSPGYDINCFIGSGKTGCITGTDPNDNYYLFKDFILYLDHGSPTGWADTISSAGIPTIWNDSFLNSPVVFGDACLTSNYWQGGAYTLGPNWIRKGAIAYYGAVGVANYPDCWSGYSYTVLGKRYMDYVTGRTRSGVWVNRSLGEASEAMDHCTEECCMAGVCWLDNCTYPEEYILLGDPSLVPRFKPRS